MCGAADTLTALGVRVQVFQPAIPWPRSGRYVISDHVGRLGDLAVSTAVRGATDDGRSSARSPSATGSRAGPAT